MEEEVTFFLEYSESLHLSVCWRLAVFGVVAIGGGERHGGGGGERHGDGGGSGPEAEMLFLAKEAPSYYSW